MYSNLYYLIVILNLSVVILLVKSLPTHHFGGDDVGNLDGVITTQVIDLNNPDHDRYLRQFNMSLEQLKRIRSASLISTDTAISDDNEKRLSDIKQLRYQDIRNKIENAVNSSIYKPTNNLPIHEMAAYPTCMQTDETTWLQDNNVTITFSANLFASNYPDMFLDTAVLRLFKINPHPEGSSSTPKPNSCEEQPIETHIRVTVSTLQQVRRNKRVVERKKRICNTVMLNLYQTGWIEIDIKKAINVWEKAQSGNYYHSNNNNSRFHVMIGYLAIEVHDEDEKPLKAGLYFEPPKCSEAYPAIPWNFYRQHSSRTSSNTEKVPRSPRLDIKIIDYRSVNPLKFTSAPSATTTLVSIITRNGHAMHRHNHFIGNNNDNSYNNNNTSNYNSNIFMNNNTNYNNKNDFMNKNENNTNYKNNNNNSNSYNVSEPSLAQLIKTSGELTFDSNAPKFRIHKRRHAQNHHSRHSNHNNHQFDRHQQHSIEIFTNLSSSLSSTTQSTIIDK